MADISAIVTAHCEAIMLGTTLRSLIEAAEHAEQSGLTVERLVLLDRPDRTTRGMVVDRPEIGLRVVEVDFGDQGKVRNTAVQEASGEFLAFLDGDDLWGFNWLTDAIKIARQDAERTIVHPEFNWFFGGQQSILRHTDQDDPGFDAELLRTANYWDALCLAHRSIHLRFPYCDRDIANGFALEDHHWNCITLEAGLRHRVARDTVHFKRRRSGSQFAETTQSGAIRRPTALSYYDWYRTDDPRPAPGRSPDR
jgi:hypothetical protein